MNRKSLSRAAAALLVAAAAAGCTDDLPTVVGPDQFPGGSRLTSGVVFVPASGFLQEIGAFDGYTGIPDAGYNLVANAFDGALQARTLARFAAFPDSVVFLNAGTTVTERNFQYTSGVVVLPVDTAATSVGGAVRLRLYAAGQAWDRGSATWTLATDTLGARVAWNQPGGTLGPQLAETTWAPNDTTFRDTIRWQVDSLSVARMAAEGFPGVIVVAEGPASRIQVGTLTLRTAVRPAVRPDTTLAQTVGTAASTFVVNPAPPPAAGGWLVGGVTSARTLFRVTLPDSVPVCAPGQSGAACPRRALRDVTLNEVSLLMRPIPTGGGFRPLVESVVRLRTIREPELGRRAPLGPPVVNVGSVAAPLEIAQAFLPPQFFAAATDTTVALRMTQHAADLLAADTVSARVSTTFALVAEPEGATFGYVRFAATPQLRIVYTLPALQSSP